MTKVYDGAMISIMALLLFGAVLSLGGVTPELLAPWFFLGLIALVLWAGRMAMVRDAGIKSSPIHFPVLVFTAYAVVRYLTSPVEYEGRLEIFQLFFCVAAYFIAVHIWRNPRHRLVLICLLAGLAVFEAMYGIWQALTRTDAIFHWLRTPSYRGRASGTFVCPNHLAGCLHVIVSMLVARLVLVRAEAATFERSMLVKVGLIYASATAAAGIAFTQSRAGWLAAAVGVGVVLFWGRRLSRRLLVAIGLLVVVAGLLVAIVSEAGWSRVGDTVKRDPGGGFRLNEATLGGRVLMAKGTLGMIREHPFFGSGPGTWQWLFQARKDPRLVPHPEYAHNDHLNLLSDYGVAGGLLMAWLVVAIYRQARVLGRLGEPPEQRAFAIGTAAAVSAILVHSLFDFNLHIPGNAVVLAVVVGAMAGMDDSSSRYTVRPLGRSRWALAGAVLGAAIVAGWYFVPTVLSAHFDNLGAGFRRRFEYEAALHYYRKAIATDLRAPQPQMSLGETYLIQATLRLGPEKKAERRELGLLAKEAFDYALQMNPRRSAAWLGRGRACEMAGEDGEALESYRKAIEVDPVNPAIYFRLGCFYRDRGDLTKAEVEFEKSQRLRHVEDMAALLNIFDIRNR